MKHSRRFTILLVALSLLAVCVAAEEPAAFTFRNGITWDSTAEDMLTAEGFADASAMFKTQTERYTSYTLEGVPVFMVPAVLSYYYKQDTLVAAAYFFERIPAFGFDERLQRFTEVYGEPTEFDTFTAWILFNAVIPGSLDEDEVLSIGGWTLSDGTYLYMLDLTDELMFVCFNAQALLPN